MTFTGFSFSCLLIDLELIKIEIIRLRVIFILDIYSILFISRVRLIGGCVLLFSSSYMASEKFTARFHILVLRFILSIILLILSPNLVRVLLG